MDDDLFARLESESANLRLRAQEIDKTAETRDTARGLATAMEAICGLAATAGRLDGPSGLGKSDD